MTPQQIKMARAALDWTAEKLAEESGLSKPGILNIENARSEPGARTLAKIERAFARHKVFKTLYGVELREVGVDLVDGYMAVLADIENDAPDEILFHCCDDRRSTDEVVSRVLALPGRKRLTVCEGNDFIVLEKNCYRWIPEDYYAGSNVIVIYGDKIAFHAGGPRFLIVCNDNLATVHRRQFEYWWQEGRELP